MDDLYYVTLVGGGVNDFETASSRTEDKPSVAYDVLYDVSSSLYVTTQSVFVLVTN